MTGSLLLTHMPVCVHVCAGAYMYLSVCACVLWLFMCMCMWGLVACIRGYLFQHCLVLINAVNLLGCTSRLQIVKSMGTHEH